MKKIIAFLKSILDFFGCLLKDNCVYSVKKVLTFFFSFIIAYLAVWTEKGYGELLIFVSVLLGLRSYERLQNSKGEDYTMADVKDVVESIKEDKPSVIKGFKSENNSESQNLVNTNKK